MSCLMRGGEGEVRFSWQPESNSHIHDSATLHLEVFSSFAQDIFSRGVQEESKKSQKHTPFLGQGESPWEMNIIFAEIVSLQLVV